MTKKLNSSQLKYLLIHIILTLFEKLFKITHCVKSVRIRSYFGPHFPAFGLNPERYGISLRIQSECGEMRTKINPGSDTFHAVTCFAVYFFNI